jgi:hypothetical protein
VHEENADSRVPVPPRPANRDVRSAHGAEDGPAEDAKS